MGRDDRTDLTMAEQKMIAAQILKNLQGQHYQAIMKKVMNPKVPAVVEEVRLMAEGILAIKSHFQEVLEYEEPEENVDLDIPLGQQKALVLQQLQGLKQTLFQSVVEKLINPDNPQAVEKVKACAVGLKAIEKKFEAVLAYEEPEDEEGPKDKKEAVK